MIRRKLIPLMLVLLICLLAACLGSTEENNADTVQPNKTVSVVPTPTAPLIINSNNKDDDKTELESINYYIVNPDSCELAAATAYVQAGTSVTPEQVMEFISDSMADYSITVDYDSITLEDSTMTVGLTEEIRLIAEENAKLETAILNAIAQSMLDNIAGCSSISFGIMDEPYHTVNNDFEAGYIYMDK